MVQRAVDIPKIVLNCDLYSLHSMSKTKGIRGIGETGFSGQFQVGRKPLREYFDL